jgi:tRNA dimethylallyltransferase
VRETALVLLGATATGKSELAVEVAERLHGEVISFDASCVYRGFDLGTAKPTGQQRRRVPHHLIDVAEPSEDFSAARWRALAVVALDDVARRGRAAVLAGGTGLYLRALLRGLVASPPPDPALRRRLEARERRRPGSLRRLLRRLDPGAALRLEPADAFRTARALEHRLATGRPLSADQRQWALPELLPTLKVGLALPRAEREQRIRARVARMLAAGLVEEASALRQRVPAGSRAWRAIGYRQAREHLEGRLAREDLADRIAVATRQYAKRQDTWFRREPGVTWVPAPRTATELAATARRLADLLRAERDR